MWKAENEEDYFISPLAPYVQWVKAYNQLVLLLYDEHKTVRKAWKAFSLAVPGIERRMEFGVFEQILLFSLFLSEWSTVEKTAPSREMGARAGPGAASAPAKASDRQLIDKLRDALDQKDRALWNSKNYEQDAVALRERDGRREKALQLLRTDLDGANEQLHTVTQDLEVCRREVVWLREENNAFKAQRYFLQAAGPRQEPAGEEVIQRRRKLTGEPVIQKRQGPAAAKIGKWNVQLSKDGYYRLFRKIRGKLHSIYLGKELNTEKAQRRIDDKERELLGPGPAG
ncbi:MAG: hypothetical protein P4L43_05385 [Syntrophobacteraceae bacterium]|nr:hypothetical protein [Syntrophobacteraceae bacterium]